MQKLGVIGGLGALGAADILFKLVQATAASRQQEFIFEQHPFREGDAPGAALADQNGRKLYVFDMIRRFEARGVDGIVLPCFLSHTFIDELRAEVRVPILSMMDALREFIAREHAGARRIGVLTSDHVRARRLFERHLDVELLYPSDQASLMDAVYGIGGLKAGGMNRPSVRRLEQACKDLRAQGAELILPGFTEIPVVTGLPVVDANLVYARHAASQGARAQAKPFKIGIVGGVGPAATVDFMSRIVRNTPAGRDQEHIKLVVEQNPQIPDRTAHLVGDGQDPTVPLYSTCKKLEAADADLIAIPCNTAHAFVERIQPYLGIPIVNMLTATVEHIQATLPKDAVIGLLATSGTVGSGIYHEAAQRAGLTLLVPDDEHQARVMNAIYGAQGIKAGYIDGVCRTELLAAQEHLIKRGATAVILGCTELPLVLGAGPGLLDPTEILAQRCVALAP